MLLDTFVVVFEGLEVKENTKQKSYLLQKSSVHLVGKGISQYMKPIRQLTKSMNSNGSSQIFDFQPTFLLEKLDFPCMKNCQELF